MSIRHAILLTGAALAAHALPAAAQDATASEQAIEIEVLPTAPDDVVVSRADHGEFREVHIERRPGDLAPSPEVRLAYTVAERDGWLADCRVLMADAGGYHTYAAYDDDADGGLIGGLLGLLGGGIAGNRIADGDGLLGTVIGAGIGGLAGAVIGAAIDNDGDEHDRRNFDANDLWAARYCEAYLRRYEMGGASAAPGVSYGQPVMLGQAVAASATHGHRGHRHNENCITTVREEWVEDENPVSAPRPARRAIPPRNQPSGKTVPVG